MKFNIYFTLRGKDTNKLVETPNTTNPVECANLASLLANLANNILDNSYVETVGVRVELEGG